MLKAKTTKKELNERTETKIHSSDTERKDMSKEWKEDQRGRMHIVFNIDMITNDDR